MYGRQGNSVAWLSGPSASDRAWASYWTVFTDWAPDSSGFLFLRQPIDVDVYTATSPSDLWIWQQNTQTRDLVLSGVVAATWSPKGDTIAFLSLGHPLTTPEGKWDGVQAVPEGTNPLGIGILRWPRGDLVSFLDIGDLESHNYQPKVRGSLAPIWSPDGRHVVYFDGIDSLGLLGLSGNEVVHCELIGNRDSSDSLTSPDIEWSPDGQYLAVGTDGTVRIFAAPCQP